MRAFLIQVELVDKGSKLPPIRQTYFGTGETVAEVSHQQSDRVAKRVPNAKVTISVCDCSSEVLELARQITLTPPPQDFKWYCPTCGEVTYAMPGGEACGACGSSYIKDDDEECRHCGMYHNYEETLVAIGPEKSVSGYGEFTQLEWIETHRCSECGSYFTFMNSNY